MKKSLLILTFVTIGLLNADDFSPQLIAQYITDVNGKNVRKSPELIQRWIEYGKKMEQMGIEAGKKENNGERVEEPIKWLQAKAEMSEIKADDLDEVARQLSSGAAAQLANHFRTVAKTINDAIARVHDNDIVMST